VKTEKFQQLPSKAPFSKQFEEAAGESCESAARAAGSQSSLPRNASQSNRDV